MRLPWNTTKTLAEAWAPKNGTERIRFAQFQDEEHRSHEGAQLEWTPAPNRLPYAGADDGQLSGTGRSYEDMLP
jgi:hypothetical protein